MPVSGTVDWKARSKELERALEDAIEELEMLVPHALITRQKELVKEIDRLKKVLSPF